MSKTVLITGCSSGIGRLLAVRLHEKGYQVYASSRSLDKIQTLAELGIHPLQLDVTSSTSIDNAVATLHRNGDQVDWLINNAGYGAMGPLAEMPQSEIELQFATNVFGPLALVQALLPDLKSRCGRVINIGSVSGILVTPFSGIYCATKAALHAASDALRMELAPFGIDVIVIQPGAIASEFGNNAEASLARTLRPDTIYGELKDAILKRARVSQRNPTSTEEFVATVVTVLEQKHPQAVVRTGNGSRLFPAIERWVPIPVRDWMLKRTFGLNRSLN